MNCLQYIKKCYQHLKIKCEDPSSEDHESLPTQTSIVRKKKTLVLDLDETLVHCEFKENENFNYETILDVWHRGVLYTVYLCKRPHLQQFLQQMSALYEIIVFTAGYESYCDKVLQYIDSEKHISDYYARSNCRFVNGNCLKDLNLLDRPLEQLIFIDNNPNAFELQPDNGLLIPSFLDSDEDECLLKLIPFLKYMANQPQVVPVNKMLADYELQNGSLFGETQITLLCQVDQEEGNLSEESIVVVDEPPKHRKSITLFSQKKQYKKLSGFRSHTLLN